MASIIRTITPIQVGKQNVYLDLMLIVCTPALQMHYAQLEALAFNEAFDPDSIEDFTAPPTETMKKVRDIKDGYG